MKHMKKYMDCFVSRVSEPLATYGMTNGGAVLENKTDRHGNLTDAYVKFRQSVSRVEVRTGVSCVSVEQARRKLDIETPDKADFQDTIEETKQAWLERLGHVSIDGVNSTNSDHVQLWASTPSTLLPMSTLSVPLSRLPAQAATGAVITDQPDKVLVKS